MPGEVGVVWLFEMLGALRGRAAGAAATAKTPEAKGE